MDNQPTIHLNFTCDRNWEDMTAVEGGRFCNNCQKKVIDFTNKTPDEIAAYLISSTTKVSGKFTASKSSPASPKPIWKIWLCAAAMFVAAFMSIKAATAQTINNNITKVQTQEVYSFADLETLPSFSGGEEAFISYLNKNIHVAAGTKGRVIVSMIIDKNGSLTNIKVLRGVNAEANQEVIRVLTESPKWNPGKIEGKAVAVKYTMPVNLDK